jgi:putative membrane protein
VTDSSLTLTRPRALPAFAYPGLAIGLALFTALIAYHGLAEVGAALSVAGGGLLLVATFHLVPIAADAAGWRALLPHAERPSALEMIKARWIGESINGLLPVMQLGGNLVKAQLLTRSGVPAARAAGSVVVDVTTVMLAQIVFTLLGLLLLIEQYDRTLVVPGVIGTMLMIGAAAAFYWAQRRGMFGTVTRAVIRLARRGDWRELETGGAAIDVEVGRLYADHRVLGAAVGWHFASWVIGVGEVWLALALLGHPVDLPTAFAIESLGQAVRATAFAVPWALGVQESGYVLLGAAVGLGPETSLALSLAKRVREIVLGLPGLIVWQFGRPLAGVPSRG